MSKYEHLDENQLKKLAEDIAEGREKYDEDKHDDLSLEYMIASLDTFKREDFLNKINPDTLLKLYDKKDIDPYVDKKLSEYFSEKIDDKEIGLDKFNNNQKIKLANTGYAGVSVLDDIYRNNKILFKKIANDNKIYNDGSKGRLVNNIARISRTKPEVLNDIDSSHYMDIIKNISLYPQYMNDFIKNMYRKDPNFINKKFNLILENPNIDSIENFSEDIRKISNKLTGLIAHPDIQDEDKDHIHNLVKNIINISGSNKFHNLIDEKLLKGVSNHKIVKNNLLSVVTDIRKLFYDDHEAIPEKLKKELLNSISPKYSDYKTDIIIKVLRELPEDKSNSFLNGIGLNKHDISNLLSDLSSSDVQKYFKNYFNNNDLLSNLINDQDIEEKQRLKLGFATDYFSKNPESLKRFDKDDILYHLNRNDETNTLSKLIDKGHKDFVKDLLSVDHKKVLGSASGISSALLDLIKNKKLDLNELNDDTKLSLLKGVSRRDISKNKDIFDGIVKNKFVVSKASKDPAVAFKIIKHADESPNVDFKKDFRDIDKIALLNNIISSVDYKDALDDMLDYSEEISHVFNDKNILNKLTNDKDLADRNKHFAIKALDHIKDGEYYNKLYDMVQGPPIQKHPQEHLLEKLKDYASHTKKGTIDIGTMSKLYPHLKDKFKDIFNGKGKLHVNEIDRMLNEGKETGNKYRISMDKWDGMQRSTVGEQDVYQLNFDLNNLDQAEKDIVKNIHKTSLSSNHPVSKYTYSLTKGWARVHKSPNYWIIDEIQTDYDRKVRDFMKKHGLHDNAKILQGVINRHTDWKSTLLNHIIDEAKEAGVKKIYIHTPESKAKHVGGDKVHSVWKEQYHKLPREFGFEKVNKADEINPQHGFLNLLEEHGAYVKNLTPEYHKEKLKSVNPNIVKEDVKEPKDGISTEKIPSKGDDDMEKSIKNTAKKTLFAGALLGGLAMPKISQARPIDADNTIPKEMSKPRTPVSIKDENAINDFKTNFLNAISMVESSGGKNTNHQPVEGGLHQGERALGRYGLMPVLIRDIVSKDKDLKSKYGTILNLKGDKFHEEAKKYPDLEHDVASKYYDRAAKNFGHDPSKIAHAWFNGITGTWKKIKSGEDPSNHWYVQRVMKYLNKKPVKLADN